MENKMIGRILAVDPGSKRLGIAISDPERMLAKPLMVIRHVSLEVDCDRIVETCLKNDVNLILIGQALSTEGEETPQSRHANKLADTFKNKSAIPVVLWDESESTKIAQKKALSAGVSKKKRAGHLDEHAAAVLLQDYLDANET